MYDNHLYIITWFFQGASESERFSANEHNVHKTGREADEPKYVYCMNIRDEEREFMCHIKMFARDVISTRNELLKDLLLVEQTKLIYWLTVLSGMIVV